MSSTMPFKGNLLVFLLVCLAALLTPPLAMASALSPNKEQALSQLPSSTFGNPPPPKEERGGRQKQAAEELKGASEGAVLVPAQPPAARSVQSVPITNASASAAAKAELDKKPADTTLKPTQMLLKKLMGGKKPQRPSPSQIESPLAAQKAVTPSPTASTPQSAKASKLATDPATSPLKQPETASVDHPSDSDSTGGGAVFFFCTVLFIVAVALVAKIVISGRRHAYRQQGGPAQLSDYLHNAFAMPDRWGQPSSGSTQGQSRLGLGGGPALRIANRVDAGSAGLNLTSTGGNGGGSAVYTAVTTQPGAAATFRDTFDRKQRMDWERQFFNEEGEEYDEDPMGVAQRGGEAARLQLNR